MVGDLFVELLVRDGVGAVGLAVGGVDEHQVDIGAVVEFAASELAEGDHAHAAFAERAVFGGISRHAMARDEGIAKPPVAGFENGDGEIGKLLGDFGKSGEAEGVAHQDAENLLAAKESQEHRLGLAGGFAIEERGEQRRVFLHRPGAIHGVELLEPVRMFQAALGKKPAEGEDGGGGAELERRKD